jgi:hypothetical protein
VPRHELWPPPPDRWPDPLDEPAPLHHRDPFGPSPSEWPPVGPRIDPLTLDTDVAEPLAALLEVLAGRIEHDDETVDSPTTLNAVNVARSVLRSHPTAPADGPEESGGGR